MATPTYAKLAAEAQEQTLKAIEQAQDASIKLASLVSEQCQQLPANVILRELPTPAQTIESSFDFAARVLELQKQYALRLAGVIPTVTEPKKD
jgi:hypothetical protein